MDIFLGFRVETFYLLAFITKETMLPIRKINNIINIKLK